MESYDPVRDDQEEGWLQLDDNQRKLADRLGEVVG